MCLCKSDWYSAYSKALTKIRSRLTVVIWAKKAQNESTQNKNTQPLQ